MADRQDTETYQTAKCDVCNFFDAEILEEVENAETGERRGAALCVDCHDKAVRYAREDDVSFEDELRLSRGDSE